MKNDQVDNRDTERPSRRRYLGAIGAFAVATLAGCSSGGRGTTADDEGDGDQDPTTETTTTDDGAQSGTTGGTASESATGTSGGGDGCSPSLTYESYTFSARGYEGDIARCDVPEAATIEASSGGYAFTVWYDYGGRDDEGVQREMRYDVETNYSPNVTVDQFADAVRDGWVEKTSEFSFADDGTRIFYQEDQPFPTDAQILLPLSEGSLKLDVAIGRKHCPETSGQIWQRLAGSVETV